MFTDAKRKYIENHTEEMSEALNFIFDLDDNITYGSKEYYDMLINTLEEILVKDDKFKESYSKME